MSIKNYIPNTITCLNLFSGCMACVSAFNNHFDAALAFIILSAVFDFFDGMAARLLHVSSPIGKELDSLADDISFGMAPASMVFAYLLNTMHNNPLTENEFLLHAIPYTAFLIAVFSGLRLAKFNIDTRQTYSFIGLPVPANALFWASLIYSLDSCFLSNSTSLILFLLAVLAFSLLLVSNLPMFSFKFKNLSWKDNKIKFLFLPAVIVLLCIFGILGIAFSVLLYILTSVALALFAPAEKKAN